MNNSDVNLPLTIKEWYFLHNQVEEILKDNPDNYVAQGIMDALVDNLPSIETIRKNFKKEYKCVWEKFSACENCVIEVEQLFKDNVNNRLVCCEYKEFSIEDRLRFEGDFKTVD